MKQSMRVGTGRCFPASNESMSMSKHAGIWVGNPAMISATCSTASEQGLTLLALWHVLSDRRDTILTSFRKARIPCCKAVVNKLPDEFAYIGPVLANVRDISPAEFDIDENSKA